MHGPCAEAGFHAFSLHLLQRHGQRARVEQIRQLLRFGKAVEAAADFAFAVQDGGSLILGAVITWSSSTMPLISPTWLRVKSAKAAAPLGVNTCETAGSVPSCPPICAVDLGQDVRAAENAGRVGDERVPRRQFVVQRGGFLLLVGREDRRSCPHGRLADSGAGTVNGVAPVRGVRALRQQNW